jgi:hypothetical protein
MNDPVNDPTLVAMERILRRIDELEAVINKLFARMDQIEANHERLFRALPSTPPAPPPSLN